MSSNLTIYAAAGIPAPASGDYEFALDADVWFEALISDPHRFFGMIPLFTSHREYGVSLVSGIYKRGGLFKTGSGYKVDMSCVPCHARNLRYHKRNWAMRVSEWFLRMWNNPGEHQNLKNQVSEFFLTTRPEITERGVPIVFNAHTRSGERKKLIVYQPKKDSL